MNKLKPCTRFLSRDRLSVGFGLVCLTKLKVLKENSEVYRPIVLSTEGLSLPYQNVLGPSHNAASEWRVRSLETKIILRFVSRSDFRGRRSSTLGVLYDYYCLTLDQWHEERIKLTYAYSDS